jgi:putative cardiolipin synthase
VLIAAGAAVIGALSIFTLNRIAGLPDHGGREYSHLLAANDDTRIGSAVSRLVETNNGRAGLYELPRGLDAFAARVVLMRQADRSIDAQYYMWHQDIVGRFLVYELVDAANRGVRVRLLVDDMYGGDGEDTWLAMDAHPNIEVRLFAPYSRRQPKVLQFLTRFHDVNARMHTKTLTVDRAATIVGGRNIGDEYFGANTDLEFADNDVLAIGSPADEVSAVFNDYWNSDYAYSVSRLASPVGLGELQQLEASAAAFRQRAEVATYVSAVERSSFADALRDYSLKFRWGQSELIHDPWWKRDQSRPGWQGALLISGLAPHILAAESEIIIVSPYFVPDQDVADALCAKARSRIPVRILTNSLASNDVVAVHAGYRKYRRYLLECGVELFEFNEHLRTEQRKSFSWLENLEKSSLHAKTMIFDREKMFVGSFNLDQRSLYLNTEIGLVFEQPEIAARAAESFVDNIRSAAFEVRLVGEPGEKQSLLWVGIEGGEQVSLTSEPYVGFGTKSAVAIMRLFPVNWLL